MTAKEAWALVLTKRSDLKKIKCVEYNTLFVFQTAPKNIDPSKYDQLLNNSISVNKSTSEIRVFRPFDISPKEYRDGKELEL